jgi:hypothetical protein
VRFLDVDRDFATVRMRCQDLNRALCGAELAPGGKQVEEEVQVELELGEGGVFDHVVNLKRRVDSVRDVVRVRSERRNGVRN